MGYGCDVNVKHTPIKGDRIWEENHYVENKISYMGHSWTYQPKLHHYVTYIGDFLFKDDIYDEN